MMNNNKNDLIQLKSLQGLNKIFHNNSDLQPYTIKITSGVDLILHDYKFEDYSANIVFSNEIVRLDYAISGSINIQKNKKNYLFFEPGFLKISREIDEHRDYSSTNDFFQAITIMVNIEKLNQDLLHLINGKHNFIKCISRLLDTEKHVLIKSEFIERLFTDIVSMPINNSLSFLNLKVSELLLYIVSEDAVESSLPKTYIPVELNKKVNDIHNYLISHVSDKINLKKLSYMFDIRQSMMQRLFKSIYFQSIHQFLMSVRLDKACYLLKSSNLNIAIIANNVGYSSSSKFAEFFKKAKKMTPTKYRSMYKDNKITYVKKQDFYLS